MKKIVLITGATAGIGEASAKKFAANGWDIIITGRRQEKLAVLSESLIQKYGVDVLAICFDVTSRNDTNQAINSLEERWKNIDVLVNNAGLALGIEKFQDANQNDWDTMIDTNITGLLNVTKAVSPNMIKRKSGHIINLASIAGHTIYPTGHVYCATKAAVLALTKAMRLDMVRP